jgi:hypothetical protein
MKEGFKFLIFTFLYQSNLNSTFGKILHLFVKLFSRWWKFTLKVLNELHEMSLSLTDYAFFRIMLRKDRLVLTATNSPLCILPVTVRLLYLIHSTFFILTSIMFLDIIHRPVYFLKDRPAYFSKHNVSETGFCSRPEVKPTQLGPIDRVVPISGQDGFLENRQDDG